MFLPLCTCVGPFVDSSPYRVPFCFRRVSRRGCDRNKMIAVVLHLAGVGHDGRT